MFLHLGAERVVLIKDIIGIFDIDNTTVMEEATFPLVTIRTDGELINILHGYSSNLDANSIRDALTPISGDGSFEVLINQEDYEIKKLNFEVREFVGNELIEKGSVSVFQEEDDIKIAKINISSEIENGKEYAVKITLITSESRKMYYYHRIKKYQQTNINEKLDFVMSFHQATKDKEAIKEYSQNLEPNSKKDNTSLTHVNIHSSMDLISWGDLNPEFITDVIPTVVENYPDIASVVLEYIVRANVSGIPEWYRVKEYYRIRYSPNQMYLLNYERRMESVFDSALASVSKSQLKLGITSDTDIAHISSPDKKKLVFVRNRELWFYNLEKNEMVRIFSFRQEETDYIRDMYEQHDIRILNMDAEGNVDFIVYGYMNRGHYEGRVAVILYRYIRNEQRIEEKVYIPVDEPYQTLKENLGEFAYVNSLDVFYFQIYDKIYAYDLITRQLTELAGNVDRDDVVVFYEEGYVAWQESSNPKEANSIKIMDLETSDIQLIVPKPGYKVILLDKIDSNLICGYVDEKDITTLIDGAVIVPMKNVEIVTTDREVLKPYSKPDFYIRGVEVKDNVIELFRSQKDLVGGRIYFQDTTNDYIMNKIVEKTPFIKAVPRITEAALTEYYMELPSSFIMEEEPSVLTTVNTVISQDPTLRLPKENDLTYYAFVMGELVGAYDEAADAIAVADEGVGVVRSSFKHLVWERGVNANRSVLNGFNNDDIISGDSLESSIKMLIKYTGKNIDNKKLDLINQSAYEILEEYLSEDPIRLTGTSLDQVMYFISQKRPVIAMTSRTDAVLIYGYDASNIYMVDPKQGKTIKMGIQDSQALFEEGGNVYLSYLE